MTAEPLIADLEMLPLGEPWASPLAAAAAAISRDRSTADAAMFPREIAPTTADAIAQYTMLIDRISAAGYGASLVEVHKRAHPELARLLRSPECLDDIGAAAAQLSAPAHNLETHAAAAARASTEARERYKLEIARQIAEVDGHELADAARALIAAAALGDRLAAAKARHEETARAELDREAAQQQAADAAVAAEAARRVLVASETATAAQVAALVAANDLRLARAESLRAKLHARLEAARRSPNQNERAQLEYLRTRETNHHVESLMRETPYLSNERIAWFEAALVHEGNR